MALSNTGKKVLITSSIVFVLFVFLIGIGGFLFLRNQFSYEAFPGSHSTSFTPSYEAADSLMYEMGSPSYEMDRVTSNLETDLGTDAKIRKNGSIGLSVEDLDESYDQVTNLLKNYDGGVLNIYESGSGNERTISLTIKVDSRYFEDVYTSLRDLDGDINYASFTTDDVTMEYTDLQSRLRNLRSTEDQFIKILATADTVSDTLEVHKELSNIRSRIEVIEGQIKYLDSQVDYSHITVNLNLRDSGKAISDETWRPLGVFRNALSSLVSFGKSLVNIVIWLVVFTPLWLVFFGVYILIKRKKATK